MSGLETLLLGMFTGGAAAAGAGAAATGLGTLGTVLTVGSTALSAVGALKGAADKKAGLQYQAQVQEQQADRARAAGQRAAAARYRQGQLLKSDQQAVGAFTGGLDDPSVINIMGLTDFETNLGVRTTIADSQQAAIGYDAQARSSRTSAKRAGRGGTLSALGIGIGGASTIYDRYAKAKDYRAG